MRRTLALAGVLLLGGCSLAYSQSSRSATWAHPADPFPRHDIFNSPLSSISPLDVDTTSDTAATVRERKSPALAVLFSAALPGIGGQVYTEDYWKVPIYLGLFYWFGKNYRDANNLYRQYRDLFSQSLEQGVNSGQGDARLQYIRDFYVNERERFATYLLITYLLNIVDAYVSASLYSFDVGKNLDGTTDLRLTLRVPLR